MTPAEMELNQQPELLRLLLENLAEGVVACDAEGRLAFFNKAARSWHGVDVSDLPQTEWANYYDLYCGDGQTPLRTEEIPLVRAFRGEEVHEAAMCIVARGHPPRFVVASGGPLFDAVGGRRGAVIVMHDVTDRRQAENALREKERHLSESQRIAHIGSWHWNMAGPIVWSDETYRIYGVSPDAFTPDPESFLDLIHPEDRAAMQAWLAACAAGQELGHLEFRHVMPDGTVRFASGRGEMQRDAANRPVQVAGTVQDVTSRVLAERVLSESLQEKEVLLKEIHHRVKNNLQIIASLLALQSDATADAGTRELLQKSIHRVRSMSLIHERLYQSETLGRIDFGEYAEALAGFLVRSYGVGSVVALVVDMKPTELDIEMAVPCGLILNELVSNALKHAFTDGRAGELRVTIRPEPEGGFSMTVADSGPGLPAGFAIEQATSLGLQLVVSLTKQIKGRLTIRNHGGASFCITFKELTHGA